jgi:hypothetical protein
MDGNSEKEANFTSAPPNTYVVHRSQTKRLLKKSQTNHFTKKINTTLHRPQFNELVSDLSCSVTIHSQMNIPLNAHIIFTGYPEKNYINPTPILLLHHKSLKLV